MHGLSRRHTKQDNNTTHIPCRQALIWGVKCCVVETYPTDSLPSYIQGNILNRYTGEGIVDQPIHNN